MLTLKRVHWQRIHLSFSRSRPLAQRRREPRGVGLLCGVEWFIGTGRWEAVGSASTQIGDRCQHLTMLVKLILGNWQLVYQHVG